MNSTITGCGGGLIGAIYGGEYTRIVIESSMIQHNTGQCVTIVTTILVVQRKIIKFGLCKVGNVKFNKNMQRPKACVGRNARFFIS